MLKPDLRVRWDGDEVFLSYQPLPVVSVPLGAPRQPTKPSFNTLSEGQKVDSSSHLWWQNDTQGWGQSRKGFSPSICLLEFLSTQAPPQGSSAEAVGWSHWGNTAPLIFRISHLILNIDPNSLAHEIVCC